jgi:hypothetical protein
MPTILPGCDSRKGAISANSVSAGPRHTTSSGTARTSGSDIAELTGPAAAIPRQPIDWRHLSSLRVVFGHQSVGKNILSGIERLAARDGVTIDIHERRMTPALPGINHFLIGRNGDPMSKILDFAAALDAGAAQGADVALMKLCYVDFETTTDARKVANDYIASLESLSSRHPGTSFVAVTAPLVAPQTGPKAWIKRIVGELRGGYSENGKRTEFNALLRERYFAEGRLFDLARIESEASSDWTRVDEHEAEALSPELTDDGGHLNERGQVLVAGALLGLVNSIAGKKVAG